MVDLGNSDAKAGRRKWNLFFGRKPIPTIITTDHSAYPPLPVKQRINPDAYDTDGGTNDRHYLTSHHNSPISPQILRRHGASQTSSPRTPSRNSFTKGTLSHATLNPQDHHHHEEHEIYSNLPARQDIRKHIRNSRILPTAMATTTPSAHESLPARHTLSIIDHHQAVGRRSPTVAHDVHEQQRQAKERIQNHLISHQTAPLRFIFIRHAERANQALGPEWFLRAFDQRTGAYHRYDVNLPETLPTRTNYQAYELDPPLTVKGLKLARITGEKLMNNRLSATVCLTSSALRCVQTGERLLIGMQRQERIPIRVEPGLFECPHFNPNLVDSFMTKNELLSNYYNVKADYKPIIPKINVPETLEQYFLRSQFVMQHIINRYSLRGGNVLIVTHAPGLIALTDALLGNKSDANTLYGTASRLEYLTSIIAEYESGRWKFRDQPLD